MLPADGTKSEVQKKPLNWAQINEYIFTVMNVCMEVTRADFPPAVIFSAKLFQVLSRKMISKQTYSTLESAE
jgi:hypothetical protein